MKKTITAPTPPMGFNTWDCYGAAVNEEQLLGNAEYMKNNLLEYGWQYVVCDIQWYEPNAKSTAYNDFAPLCMDEVSRLIPAPNRFPSAAGGKGFKPIADKIHAMGLKFGIHILRGIPRAAVHANTPTVTEGVGAADIAQSYSICPWNTDMYGVDPSKKGAAEYYNSLFQLYAQWGVDFVKVDDIANTEFLPHNPYSAAGEIELIRAAIDNCGRPMVLSLSPGPAPLDKAFHLKQNADMWRMSGDFWDRSDALTKMFALCEKWYAHTGNGCWPDCDMLPLGTLCMNDKNPENRARATRFTKDEQYMLMNLWCIFRSPLFFGGEMRLNDDFTLSLLQNRALIAINQNSQNNCPLVSDGEKAVWTCELDGKRVYAVFNLNFAPQSIKIPSPADGEYKNLWNGEHVFLTSEHVFNLAARQSVIIMQSE